MTISRTCPCCGTEFEPSSYSAVTCSPACSKRAYRLRQKQKAHVSGERNVTPKVLADAQRVLEADRHVADEASLILAGRNQAEAQRRAELEAQRARKETERALLVQAREAVKANRKARRAARDADQEGPELMAERNPIAIAAKEMAKDGYCTEVLAYAIAVRRDWEEENEEWKQKHPL
ncbi:MAG: hypothetical protein AAF550_00290 [Myxococcota bacterium]